MKKNQTIPKVTYQYVESPDSQERLRKAYKILFDAVWESQDWGGKNDSDPAEKPIK